MSNENEDFTLPSELALIAQHWPEQIVTDYMPYGKAWRQQFPGESPRTFGRYIRLFRHWCALANGRNLDPRLILEWNAKMRATGLSGGTLNRANGHLRSFIQWLKAVGVISMDPTMALARYPSVTARRVSIFTHGEYERIVAYGEADPDKYALATWLVVLSYHTGLSLVDACHIRWDEVQLDPSGPCYIQHIRIKMQTRMGTKALCTIPIIPGGELWNWIQRLEKAHRGQSDYVHPEGPAFYKNNALEPKRVFKRLFNGALGGFGPRKGRTFKCLRNTFCSRMLNSGVDAVMVSKMTGHLNLSQLSVYVTPDIRTMQDAVAKGMRHVQDSTEVIALQLPEQTG